MVDAPLDYNLLLGRNWMSSMQAVASSLFRVVCFPLNGKIVTIDQTSFKNPSVTTSSGASISIVEHSQPETGSVGVGMYPSLMGSFSCPAPILMIGSSSGEALTSVRSVSFRMSHMEDPWILPIPNTLSDPIVMDMLLHATMVAYQANLGCVAEPSPSSSWTEEEDPYVLPAWPVESSHAHDFLDSVFHEMKLLLRPFLELSHLGKSYIIDLILFVSLTV